VQTMTSSTIALCHLDDIPTGLGRGFDVAGKRIAVFKSRTGRVFAVDGVCPHKNGPIADGMIVGESVVCPLHTYRFDATTGACDQATVCSIATYPVEVRRGVVHLTVTPS
jgi:nitrite reductase [NAD(P)H] small subunit